jgi:hypothetical protein
MRPSGGMAVALWLRMTAQASANTNTSITQVPTVCDEQSTVLVIPSGRNDEPVCSAVRDRVPASCLSLDAESAFAFLRSDPFAVTAVVLCGDGKSSVTSAVLEGIKAVAPRVPVVFLDERESPDSEMTIRRAGIHYYTHLPANSGEIVAVLTHLVEAPGEPAGRQS